MKKKSIWSVVIKIIRNKPVTINVLVDHKQYCLLQIKKTKKYIKIERGKNFQKLWTIKEKTNIHKRYAIFSELICDSFVRAGFAKITNYKEVRRKIDKLKQVSESNPIIAFDTNLIRRGAIGTILSLLPFQDIDILISRIVLWELEEDANSSCCCNSLGYFEKRYGWKGFEELNFFQIKSSEPPFTRIIYTGEVTEKWKKGTLPDAIIRRHISDYLVQNGLERIKNSIFLFFTGDKTAAAVAQLEGIPSCYIDFSKDKNDIKKIFPIKISKKEWEDVMDPLFYELSHIFGKIIVVGTRKLEVSMDWKGKTIDDSFESAVRIKFL